MGLGFGSLFWMLMVVVVVAVAADGLGFGFGLGVLSFSMGSWVLFEFGFDSRRWVVLG